MSINRFIHSMLRHSVLIIVLTLAATAFMAYQAVRVDINTNVNTLMPQQNSRILLLKEKLGVEDESSNYAFVSITSENLYSLEVLQAFQRTIDQILAIDEVVSVLSPFDFVYFESEGRRIIPTTIVESGRAPQSPEALAQFEERIKTYSLSENFVTADDGRVLTAVFNTVRTEETHRFMEEFDAAIAPLREVATVYSTGELAFQERVAELLGKDFSVLLILALMAMLTIFWLSFRSFRAVILPIIVVVIGAVWSIGFMSLVGFPITVVSVIIPSLILTIGSSYTIHVLNEYFRNTKAVSPEEKRRWLADAVEHVFRTVVVAGLTTMISFLSLLTTTLEPLQEFGLSISLGILFCTILALFFLPAVFTLLGPPREKHRDRVHKGNLTKLVALLGQWSAKHRRLILSVFVLLFVAFVLGYPYIQHQSDYFSYFPSDDQIIQDTRFINEKSGGSQTFNITLSAPEGQEGFFLDPEILLQVDEFEALLDDHPSITNKLSFNAILKSMNQAVTGDYDIPESRGLILLLNRYFRMIPFERFSLGKDASLMNEDGNSITIFLRMAESGTYNIMNENDLREFLAFATEETENRLSESMDVQFWGNTLLLLDASRTIKRDQMISTTLSILLGTVIMFFFFRSLSYSLLALIPLLSGIFFYFVTLYLFGIPLDMTTILVTNVTVGVGLDDAVHFILQYRKQREVQPYRLALSTSLRITGRPIVLTTLSLVTGLMMLCFASFKPVIYFGFLISGTLFSTMVGTVVFIPAAVTFFERLNEKRLERRSKAD